MKICVKCKIEFKGRGSKYCSYECYRLGSRKRVEVACANCQVVFEKTFSNARIPKHGFHFCSNKCKSAAQAINGSCPEIQPKRFGVGKRNNQWLRRYINENPNCAGCNDSRKYLLQVHHIDGNNKNNEKSNLEIVCSNCHNIRHLKLTNGEWVRHTKSLTPRDKIENLTCVNI